MNLAKIVKSAMSAVPDGLKKSVTFTLGTTSITGTASQDSGAYRSYLKDGLITAEDDVVLFVPDTAGQCPEEGYVASGFTGADMVTKKVFPIAPAGFVVAATVVVGR